MLNRQNFKGEQNLKVSTRKFKNKGSNELLNSSVASQTEQKQRNYLVNFYFTLFSLLKIRKVMPGLSKSA